MDHTFRKRPPLRPNGKPMTPDDISRLRETIATFYDVTWLGEATREAIERLMPELLDRSPGRASRTIHQALSRKRFAAKRKAIKNRSHPGGGPPAAKKAVETKRKMPLRGIEWVISPGFDPLSCSVPSFCSIGTILPPRPVRARCRRAQRPSRMARLRATRAQRP